MSDICKDLILLVDAFIIRISTTKDVCLKYKSNRKHRFYRDQSIIRELCIPFLHITIINTLWSKKQRKEYYRETRENNDRYNRQEVRKANSA